jgi:folylpolyglutamate synthase/dihydropteroate synthase
VPAAVRNVEIAGSPVEALERAGRAATTPVICVAGSLFLIGDVLRYLAGSDKPCSLEKGTASMSLPF